MATLVLNNLSTPWETNRVWHLQWLLIKVPQVFQSTSGRDSETPSRAASLISTELTDDNLTKTMSKARLRSPLLRHLVDPWKTHSFSLTQALPFHSCPFHTMAASLSSLKEPPPSLSPSPESTIQAWPPTPHPQSSPALKSWAKWSQQKQDAQEFSLPLRIKK